MHRNSLTRHAFLCVLYVRRLLCNLPFVGQVTADAVRAHYACLFYIYSTKKHRADRSTVPFLLVLMFVYQAEE